MADREKVVERLQRVSRYFKSMLKVGYDGDAEIYREHRESVKMAIELLKEQEAKPPIHVHEEYPEHDWETDEDGKIDEWAMSYGFHNGPMCKRCYHSFCIHCKPNGFNDGPCVIDEYKCPKCGRILR